MIISGDISTSQHQNGGTKQHLINPQQDFNIFSIGPQNRAHLSIYQMFIHEPT